MVFLVTTLNFLLISKKTKTKKKIQTRGKKKKKLLKTRLSILHCNRKYRVIFHKQWRITRLFQCSSRDTQTSAEQSGNARARTDLCKAAGERAASGGRNGRARLARLARLGQSDAGATGPSCDERNDFQMGPSQKCAFFYYFLLFCLQNSSGQKNLFHFILLLFFFLHCLSGS